MNYQITQIEKNKLENNFLNKRYISVEKDAHSLVEKGFNQPWIYNVLAITYAKQKKFKNAEKMFLKVISFEPNDFDHYFNLANLYRESKNYKNCIEALKLAIKIKPKDMKCLLSLSAIYSKVHDIENGLKIIKIILNIEPNNMDAMKHEAYFLVSSGRFKEALERYSKILKKDNYNKAYFSDISVCYIFLGDFYNAERFNNLADESVNTQYNKGIIQLLQGNYKDGWDNFESGLITKSRILRKGHEKFDQLPFWSFDKNFSSIVLIGEQGIGDEIMYSTIISSLTKKIKNIFMLCDPRLEGILKNRFRHLKFLNHNQLHDIKKFESKLPIGSLPKFFRQNERKFLEFHGHLDTNNFKDHKIDLKTIRTIGISWHTTNKQFGPERNISLDYFTPILKNKNLNFINLQYGNHESEIINLESKLNRKIFINKNNDNINNIDGLAENIKKCDLVITIDNSTVHLSGFLNINTFLLLPFVSDWRWQKSRNDTPWYGSVKLFRQKTKSDWNTVINQIKVEFNNTKV